MTSMDILIVIEKFFYQMKNTSFVLPSTQPLFKDKGDAEGGIPIVFQNFSFPRISIPIFTPLCIAPIYWIGACFERIKSQALILAKSKISKHNRYKKRGGVEC